MFVSIEGIDGAGKTTLCNILQERFPDATVLKKKDLPHYSPIFIRPKLDRLHDEIWGNGTGHEGEGFDRPLSDIFLMAGWFHMIDELVIQPCLERSQLIILDGWYYKFLCRFKGRSRYEYSLLERMLIGLPSPEIGVYLDLSPPIAAKRKSVYTASECGVLDGYDSISSSNFIDYQYCQKRYFDEFAKSGKWKILDAEEFSPDQLADELVMICGFSHLAGKE